MVYRKTLKWNNPKLKEEVSDVFFKDRKTLQGDLFDTLKIENRKIVSAPEVGLPKKAIAIDASLANSKEKYVCLFNPKVLFIDQPQEFFQSCLTLPHFSATVYRYPVIEISSDTSDGVKIFKLFDDDAAEFQKALDFMDGKTLLSRVSNLKKKMYLNKISKQALRKKKLEKSKSKDNRIKILKKRKINRTKRKAKKK